MDLLQWYREGNFSGVFIDSRKPLEGGLFICIRGDNFDGNSFALKAIASGAKSALVERHYYEDNPSIFEGQPVALVENGEEALLSLAASYRQWLDPKVIGVVGSGGKTNTKNMFAEICKKAYVTHATLGNLNNQIGLPLTLLNTPEETEVLVLEMGITQPNEMEKLAFVAKPDMVLMTNIGTSHIGYFQTKENIFYEKMKANSFYEDEHVLVVNGFDSILENMPAPPYQLIKTQPEALKILSAEQGFHHFEYKGLQIHLQVPGEFQVRNALVCIEAARAMGISDRFIQEGLEGYEGEAQRFMVSTKGGITIVDDVYNSSPDSISASLKTLLMLEGNRYIAVLGDVLELGEMAQDFHKKIGQFPEVKELDILYTIGDFASFISANHPNGRHFRDIRTLINTLNDTLQVGDVLLVKGSRGMEFERVLKGLEIADE